jgi:hypothetical protein
LSGYLPSSDQPSLPGLNLLSSLLSSLHIVVFAVALLLSGFSASDTRLYQYRCMLLLLLVQFL